MMMEHLFRLQMLLKNFKGYAGGLTERVRAGAMAFADAAGRLTYLPSAQVSKEELVRDIATRDRVAALELRLEPSRNLCINGREWLARHFHGQMGYLARDPEQRSDPRRLLPSAKSVVCVALNYYRPEKHTQSRTTGKISRYFYLD